MPGPVLFCCVSYLAQARHSHGTKSKSRERQAWCNLTLTCDPCYSTLIPLFVSIACIFFCCSVFRLFVCALTLNIFLWRVGDDITVQDDVMVEDDIVGTKDRWGTSSWWSLGNAKTPSAWRCFSTPLPRFVNRLWVVLKVRSHVQVRVKGLKRF